MDKSNFYEVRKWVYIKKNDKEFYEKCLKYDSENVDYLVGLAKKYEKLSSRRAEELYRKILEINPYNYHAKKYFKSRAQNTSPVSFRAGLGNYLKSNIGYYAVISILIAVIFFLLSSFQSLDTSNTPINMHKTSSQINTNIYLPDRSKITNTITEKITLSTFDTDEIIKIMINTSDDLRKKYPAFNINITGYRDNTPIVKLTWNNFESRDIRFLGTETISGAEGPASLSVIKTAILSFYIKNRSFPDSLYDIVKDYPNNILSQIPIEPASGSNVTYNALNGKGGWVYIKPRISLLNSDKASPNIQKAKEVIDLTVYPNITYPYNSLGFLKIIFTDRYLYLCNINKVILKKYPIGFARYNPYKNDEVFSVSLRIIPRDKSTPLGTGLLGLNKDNLAIHGTNNPRSIGKNLSSGCIRLYNKDIDELYKLVPLFTEVQYKKEYPEKDYITIEPVLMMKDVEKSNLYQSNINSGNTSSKKSPQSKKAIFESPDLKIKWRS